MDVVVACFLLVLFCSSCVLAGNIEIASMPDPFARPPRAQQGLVLEGVVRVDGQLCAALVRDGERALLKVGQDFKGSRLTAVQDGMAILLEGSRTITLRVD